MDTLKKVRIVRTKSGEPALWEEGGGHRNTGEATIIASPEGEPLRPLYVRRRGHLANGEHALLPIRPGTIVVEANHHHQDFHIQIWEVLGIEDDKAVLGLVAEYRRGEWDHVPIPEKYRPAIEAAKEKATCYHCREPHFIGPYEEEEEV